MVCAARRLRPYFQAYKVIVVTSDPLKKVLQRPEGAGKLIPWAVKLNEFDIEYTSRKAIKAHVVVEVLVDFAEGEMEEPELGIRGKVYEMSLGGEVW